MTRHRKNHPPRLYTLFAVLALLGFSPGAWAADVPIGNVHHLFDLRHGASPLSLPSDVAVAEDGRIYVVDGGHHRIVVFDAAGKFLFDFGKHGAGPGEFNGPLGIDVDVAGKVYVTDRNNHRLQIFDKGGKPIHQFSVRDGKRVVAPIDVAVAGNGERLYVTTNHHRVMEYSPQGRLLRQWGGEGTATGQFRFPATLAISRDGFIHVTDVLNTRVQVFDPAGRFVVQVSDWGVLPGQVFRPKGVAVDDRRRIYVSDSYMDVIQVFDAERRFLHVLGEDGQPRRFVSPGGIAVDKFRRLYVAEMLRNTVSVYALK